MCPSAKFSMSDHMLNIRLNLRSKYNVKHNASTQAVYVKHRWREKAPQVLWSFMVKGYAPAASREDSCEPRSTCQRTAVVLSVRCRPTCLSTARPTVRRAEQRLLSCRRALCRLTSGAEPSHGWADPDYDFSVLHPKVSITTIKSRVEADPSTSTRTASLPPSYCSTKRLNPELTVRLQGLQGWFPFSGRGIVAVVKFSARETYGS